MIQAVMALQEAPHVRDRAPVLRFDRCRARSSADSWATSSPKPAASFPGPARQGSRRALRIS